MITMPALSVRTVLEVALVLAVCIQTNRLTTTQTELGDVTSRFAVATQKAADAQAIAKVKVEATEAALSDAATQTRKEIHDQTAALVLQRDALVGRLRVSQASRSVSTRVPETSATATLRGTLPGSDSTLFPGSFGETDVDEALRADIIRTHYLACEAQYELARTALNGPDYQ